MFFFSSWSWNEEYLWPDSLENIILNNVIFGKLLFHFEVEARHTYIGSLITEEVIHVKNQTLQK